MTKTSRNDENFELALDGAAHATRTPPARRPHAARNPHVCSVVCTLYYATRTYGL